MTKIEASKLFGSYWGRFSRMARALGITRQALNQWPENLTRDQVARIEKAAKVYNGLDK